MEERTQAPEWQPVFWRLAPARLTRLSRARAVAAALLLSAIATTLLTTLLCIVHCHLWQPAHIEPVPGAVLVASEQGIFICHMPADPASSSHAPPAPLDAASLQALFQLTLASVGALLLLAARSSSLPLEGAQLYHRLHDAPEPPPPRHS
jgi:hypothetical protein